MYDARSWSRMSSLPTLKAQRRDRRFEALLLASANIVWWTNAAGEFVEEQPYWREYTGQTWEEYRGSRWVSCLHPEDRDAIIEDWKGAVSRGGLYFTQGRIWSAKHNDYRAFQTRGLPVRNETGEIEEWLGALTDIQDTIDIKSLIERPSDELARALRSLRQREAEARIQLAELQAQQERIQLLVEEVKHRSRNLIAIIQSIAVKVHAGGADFLPRFLSRLHSLAASQELLFKGAAEGVDLELVIRTQLKHLSDYDSRIEISGPPLKISAAAAQALGMTVHELATNAVKYGSLSTDRGRLQIAWSVEGEGEQDERFSFTWSEVDGPPIEAPSKRGFGRTMIELAAKTTLAGRVEFDYAADGLKWRLSCALRNLRVD